MLKISGHRQASWPYSLPTACPASCLDVQSQDNMFNLSDMVPAWIKLKIHIILILSIKYINGIGIAQVKLDQQKFFRGYKMNRKPIDIAHKILTRNWVILSVGVLLAFLAILTDK